MILSAERVCDLQFFLMDAAKRYVVARGAGVEAAHDLLASAAALDYALLLSSERADELLDDGLPIAIGVRETMVRAVRSALDFIEAMLEAPADAFEDFATRHMHPGGIFEAIAALREEGVVVADDLTFRALTLASDVHERMAPR